MWSCDEKEDPPPRENDQLTSEESEILIILWVHPNNAVFYISYFYKTHFILLLESDSLKSELRRLGVCCIARSFCNLLRLWDGKETDSSRSCHRPLRRNLSWGSTRMTGHHTLYFLKCLWMFLLRWLGPDRLPRILLHPAIYLLCRISSEQIFMIQYHDIIMTQQLLFLSA